MPFSLLSLARETFLSKGTTESDRERENFEFPPLFSLGTKTDTNRPPPPPPSFSLHPSPPPPCRELNFYSCTNDAAIFRSLKWALKLSGQFRREDVLLFSKPAKGVASFASPVCIGINEPRFSVPFLRNVVNSFLPTRASCRLLPNINATNNNNSPLPPPPLPPSALSITIHDFIRGFNISPPPPPPSKEERKRGGRIAKRSARNHVRWREGKPINSGRAYG